jgi:hypothetical protein
MLFVVLVELRLPHLRELLVIVADLISELVVFLPKVGYLPGQTVTLRLLVLLLLDHFLFHLDKRFTERIDFITVSLRGLVCKGQVSLALLKKLLLLQYFLVFIVFELVKSLLLLLFQMFEFSFFKVELLLCLFTLNLIGV